MKKSQRLRLAALQGQATRTDAEQAELATLQALAAQHPDAAQDSDDTSAAAPLTAAGFMAKLTAAFNDKAALAQKNSELSARITALETERDQAAAAKASADALLVAANAATAEAQTKLTAATGQIAAFTSALGLKPDSLADASAVRAALTAKIDAGATERLAALGFPASGLPAPSNSGTPSGADARIELWKQYNAIAATDFEARAKFWAANQKAMLA